MIFQEIYRNNLEIFIPEFFITTIFLTLLLFGTFYEKTKNNESVLIIRTLNRLIIYLLLITLLLTFNIQIPNLVLAHGTFIHDALTKFAKIILIYSTISCFVMQQKYIVEQKIVRFENSILFLIALFGSMLLVSSYNLISLYLAIEVQSLCSYILTASQRHSALSAEAGLKYFVLGAIGSSFILLGSSILYGVTGTLDFADFFMIVSNLSGENATIYLKGIFIGLFFLLSGLLFKICITL